MTHGIGLRDSRHNLKYWTRQPYFGFGVDAHSMLLADENPRQEGAQAVRFATPDSLEGYWAAANQFEPIAARAEQLHASRTLVDSQAALEESFFLGLRLNCGVALRSLKEQFGDDAIGGYQSVIEELAADGLLESSGEQLRLTTKGRLLSNEVFARFLRNAETATDIR